MSDRKLGYDWPVPFQMFLLVSENQRTVDGINLFNVSTGTKDRSVAYYWSTTARNPKGFGF